MPTSLVPRRERLNQLSHFSNLGKDSTWKRSKTAATLASPAGRPTAHDTPPFWSEHGGNAVREQFQQMFQAAEQQLESSIQMLIELVWQYRDVLR
jgi:hypothetical protein